MKQFIFALIAISTCFAQASTKELVAQTRCDSYNIDSRYTGYNRYLFSQSPDDSKVKVEITLTNGSNTEDLAYSEIRTPVIASLKKVGTQVIHLPTGTICAEFKKPLIGKRYFMDSGKCVFTTKDQQESHVDADGFETEPTCTRTFFLNVK